MCQAATCGKCGKTTWAGCGNHVDQVMQNVPVANRCTCDQKTPAGTGGSTATDTGPGWLNRLFGR